MKKKASIIYPSFSVYDSKKKKKRLISTKSCLQYMSCWLIPFSLWFSKSAEGSVFYDDLEGWHVRLEGGSGGRRYVSIQLIDTAVQQKLTHHCKAIILQLKKNLLRFLEYQEMTFLHICKAMTPFFSPWKGCIDIGHI